MKFSLKKILTAAAALVATVGMSVAGIGTANAVESVDPTKGPSLTINGGDVSLKGRTFDVYEPILITGKNGSAYTLKVNDGWLATIEKAEKAASGKTVSSESAALEYVSGLKTDAAETRQFAEALLSAAKADGLKPVQQESVTDAVTSKTFVLPNDGWYLVEETTAANIDPSGTDNKPVSLVMATPAVAATIDLKADKPIHHKNIVDDTTGKNQRKDDQFATNQAHAYELTFQVPANWANQYKDNGFWFQMNDTASKGLTIEKDSFQVKVDHKAWDASVQGYEAPKPAFAQAAADGSTSFAMSFGSADDADSAKNLSNKGLAGHTVEVYYTARLNSAAVIGSTGNPNESYVEYQHSPYTKQGGDTTPHEHTHVFAFDMHFTKVDGDDPTQQLSGAKFQVLGSDGQALKFDADPADKDAYVLDANGSIDTVTTDGKPIQFRGLVPGTYKLHEVQAPAGYRTLGSDIEVTITNTTAGWSTHADHSQSDDAGFDSTYTVNNQTADTNVQVKNYKGNLPQTGGTGIIALVAAGLLLLVGGAVVLVRQHRNA